MYLANKSIFLMHTTSMKVVCLILIILFLVMLLLFLSPKIKVMIILSERTQSAYYLVSNKFKNIIIRLIMFDDYCVVFLVKEKRFTVLTLSWTTFPLTFTPILTCRGLRVRR